MEDIIISTLKANSSVLPDSNPNRPQCRNNFIYPVMQPDQNEITNLKETQQGIIKGLEYLSVLNENYKTKQEKSFMNTFLHVMDRMSNELRQAHEHYDNIDKEIEADEKCLHLTRELNFFKNECIQLQKQLDLVNQQAKKEKQKSKVLNKSNKFVSQALMGKVLAIQKYRSMTSRQGNDINSTVLISRESKSIEGRSSFLEQTTVSKDNPGAFSNDRKTRRYEKQIIRQEKPSRFSSVKMGKFEQKSELFEFSPAKFQTVELRNEPRYMRYSQLSGPVR